MWTRCNIEIDYNPVLQESRNTSIAVTVIYEAVITGHCRNTQPFAILCGVDRVDEG